MRKAAIALLLLTACEPPASTSLSVSNTTTSSTTVYVAFGSDSVITADDWDFCSGSGLNCNFDLAASASKPLPNPDGKYVNATFSFGEPVGCGSTKAEVNINNPSWYDILDVSMVDGYNKKIKIDATPKKGSVITMGPPKGQTGNESVYGLFPYGCDICVERQDPPCGIPKGKVGCKEGTQNDPKVPCQYQGPTKGGGNLDVEIKLES